eukprot:CAMPEP_0119009042 /NCGR_PEP_ID=MMETSP1176-20130426/4107_1 /TAXON_ID=265551 /ORGANISM="Synedropsis recta cf, Strain CCMP1620" /LENGTH=346 /DNA_ID=CAMNT_0006961485 /DNA_START=66 /DNA_END=1106 /DNA_ORIENTATION=-
MSTLLDNLDSPLAIGTLQWGTTPVDKSIINPHGVISETEAAHIVAEATKAGVTIWDTAEGYGGGTSEKRLGRLLPPDTSIVLTKFLPVPWRYSHACFERAVRESCKRLDVKTIPIYLLHSPVHWRPVEFWVEAAAICKKKGLIQAMGLSNCNADQVKRAVTAGKQYGIAIVTNQVHYSLLCYNSPALQEMEVACRELNVKILGFSPIGQGLLTDGLTTERYESNRPAKMLRLQWDDLVPLRACLRELATKYEKSMAQIALNWCICHDVVPLVGCRSVKQAKDSLGCIGWQLELNDLEKLNDLALSKSTLQSPGWRRSIFVTLFGIVMIVCRTLDWMGYGIVKEAAV